MFDPAIVSLFFIGLAGIIFFVVMDVINISDKKAAVIYNLFCLVLLASLIMALRGVA